MPDSTLSALTKIRIKIRRLTNSVSTSQITDDSIDEYIDNFVLYDFPAIEKLRYLQDEFIFFTDPYIDTYETSSSSGDLLYNFKNIYSSFYSPVYINGTETVLIKSKEAFYLVNTKEYQTETVGSGDAATVAFSGTLSSIPVLRNEVSFVSIDASNSGLAVYDDGDGGLSGDCIAGGTINYITGAYSFSFTSAPGTSEDVIAQTVTYTAGEPTSILYDGNKFIVRPVPDRPYKISVSAMKRPTRLLLDTDNPDLAQWWQFIALGAAKKILEDRGQIDQIQKILPALAEQEEMVLTKTVEDLSDQRSSTIYSSPYLNKGDTNGI